MADQFRGLPKRELDPFAIELPSPSIHELALGAVEGNDPTRLLVQEAIRSCRMAAERARVACLAIHSDMTLSNGGQHVQANEVSYKLTHAALPIVDRARENMQTAINALKKKTSGPVAETGMAALMTAAEIRSILASMTPDNRMAAILTSMKENDDALACAALSTSQYLTGMTQLDQDRIRFEWAVLRKPDELERIKRLEKDMDALELAGKLLISFQRKCADQGIVATAAKSRAVREAAVKSAGLN